MIEVERGRHVRPGLLLVTEIRAETTRESLVALETAAAVAREEGQGEILFEHPAAPSYGSRYPVHPTLDTPLARVARACGARDVLVGSEPEGRPIPDADWIKVLDATRFVRQALAHCPTPEATAGPAISLCTDAGDLTIDCRAGEVRVMDGAHAEAVKVEWPSSALAQWVTGFRSAEVLDALLGSKLPDEAIRLLDALLPTTWRLSRNESWTYVA